MRIESIDHLVLTVADIEATCRFYESVLGMEVVTFGGGRRALRFGTQKINLHEVGRELDPKAARPVAGSGDLCLITAIPIAEAEAHIRAQGIAIEIGPVTRTGAMGPITSLYIRDPDQNLVEISSYQGAAIIPG